LKELIVGIDPGLSKCGYAVVTSKGERITVEVVPTAGLPKRLARDMETGSVGMVCVGNSTTSGAVMEMVRRVWPQVAAGFVDETNTTLEARRLYYEDNPPRGLLRFLPRGLLVPKAPLDGYAALLIIRRWRAQGSELAEKRQAARGRV